MNQLTQSKNTTFLPLLIPLVFVCFGLSPATRAVVPPPDGGYPGFNTAEGQNALLSLTTGTGNTAVGWLSLKSNTEGQFNTAIGAGTLLVNVGDQNMDVGTQNTALGTAALLSNTTGSYNTATGTLALSSNTTGRHNTANGTLALFSNTEGDGNTATGRRALERNTTGRSNTATGYQALWNNTIGGRNTVLGAFAGQGVTTASNVICIGSGVSGGDVSSSCYIGNIWSQSGGSQAVYVNSEGKLGMQVSSERFKDEIKPIDQISEAIYSLKPVAFRYKRSIEPSRPLSFGLIAEHVEKINPDLVTRDSEGKAISVRYDAVNAMLLNEFLKEHRKNEEQEATIARQQKQIEALAAGLQKVSTRLEASKFATGRIRRGGPAPRTVVSND